MRTFIPLLTIVLFGLPLVAHGSEAPTAETIRAAIDKSLVPIQASMAGYRERRQCFSCHHHALPMIALTEVKTRGFTIDEKNFAKQLDSTAYHVRQHKERFLNGRGPGGGVDSAGWSLWALEVGRYKPDDTTAAATEFLLNRDRRQAYWNGTRTRPPTQTSHVTRTVLSLRGLDVFGTEQQQQRIAERKARSRDWLLNVQPRDTEDKVYRLHGLSYLGEPEATLKRMRADLLKDQRDDGGWAQRTNMTSDAYATGSALVALHRAGLEVTDPAYQRGLQYLLRTQLKDGTWHVRTRSRVVQRYFESGFPHGKDQFISMAATCWATTALAQALPEGRDTEVRATTYRVLVPKKNARVTIDGGKTFLKGMDRHLAVMPTAKGWHQLEVTWRTNSYTRFIRSKKVAAQPGKTVLVDLNRRAPNVPDRIKVIYVPTPQPIVRRMCQLAKVGKNDIVFDLGCGDGRIVLTAVADFHAKKGVGIDLNPKLIARCKKKAETRKVSDRLEFRVGDVLDIEDLSAASVVMLYMGEDINLRLRPILKKTLKPGARIVSHDFGMGDWRPDQTVMIDGDDGDEYVLHLWTIK